MEFIFIKNRYNKYSITIIMKIFSSINVGIIFFFILFSLILLRYYIIDFDKFVIKFKNWNILAEHTDLDIKSIGKYIDKLISTDIFKLHDFTLAVHFKMMHHRYISEDVKHNITALKNTNTILRSYTLEILALNSSLNIKPITLSEKMNNVKNIKEIEKIEGLVNLQQKNIYKLHKDFHCLIKTHAENEKNLIIKYSRDISDIYSHEKERPFKLSIVKEDLNTIRLKEKKIVRNNIIKYILESNKDDDLFECTIAPHTEYIKSIHNNLKYIKFIIKNTLKGVLIKQSTQTYNLSTTNEYQIDYFKKYEVLLKNYLEIEFNSEY